MEELIERLGEIGLYLSGCYGNAAKGSRAEEQFYEWVKAIDTAIGLLKEEKA